MGTWNPRPREESPPRRSMVKPLPPSLCKTGGLLPECLLTLAWKPQATARVLPSSVSSLCFPAFQAILTFGPSSFNKMQGRRDGHPPSQTVFSPLGTRRPPSKGAWVVVGINSLAGGGDGDSHNQTLEASHTRQARQSSCPHLAYGL